VKQRFWLFKRENTFYFQDSPTGEQKSLGTKDRAEANRLLGLKLKPSPTPGFRHKLLKLCLSETDPKLATRTWQAAMD
jgi:hypothetical protein